MTNKWHVYMTKDGRISLAGLSLAKCEYLADAIIDSYHNVSWNSIKYFWWVLKIVTYAKIIYVCI